MPSRAAGAAHSATAIASLTALLAVWETACRLHWVSPILLSPPSKVLAALASLLASGALRDDLISTGAAFAASLLFSIVIGAAAGIAMGLSRTFYQLFHPYLVGLNS